ncbi:hypothetical protein AAHA92_22033 [Salvia divinorum]|uniref:Uncharacterized protein n=1 Tax=Salvia divinorum TaxID=28513 RepID=A0ABD1GMD5_SALDI
MSLLTNSRQRKLGLQHIYSSLPLIHFSLFSLVLKTGPTALWLRRARRRASPVAGEGGQRQRLLGSSRRAEVVSEQQGRTGCSRTGSGISGRRGQRLWGFEQFPDEAAAWVLWWRGLRRCCAETTPPPRISTTEKAKSLLW